MTTKTTTTPGLCTGWEPETPADDTLLRRFVLGYAERIERLAEASGGFVQRAPDAVMAASGSPWPFDNGVVLLRPLAPGGLDELVWRARTFFATRRPWILWSAWPTPDLSRSGLRLVGHPPIMIRPPAPFPPGAVDVKVIEVEDRERLTDFEVTLAAGFPLPVRSDAGPIVDAGLLGGPVRLFVGYRHGRPVGVAGAVPAQGLVHLDWVATLPGYRRHGAGSVLTAIAAGSSPRLPATLLASDLGRPVYRRLGFFDLLRTTIWEAP